MRLLFLCPFRGYFWGMENSDGAAVKYLAICLKWNFRLGFLFLMDSLPFFHSWVFTAGVEGKKKKEENANCFKNIRPEINQSFGEHTRRVLIFERWSEIIRCHFLVKNLHYRGWHGSVRDDERQDMRREKKRHATSERLLNGNFLISYDSDLRHDPNPVGWTTLSQFGLVLIVLHEALACRVVVDDGDVRLLIRMQNCNIDFHQRFVLPQRAGISSVQSHFNRYRLAKRYRKSALSVRTWREN